MPSYRQIWRTFARWWHLGAWTPLLSGMQPGRIPHSSESGDRRDDHGENQTHLRGDAEKHNALTFIWEN